jgi:hypothetical protein
MVKVEEMVVSLACVSMVWRASFWIWQEKERDANGLIIQFQIREIKIALDSLSFLMEYSACRQIATNILLPWQRHPLRHSHRQSLEYGASGTDILQWDRLRMNSPV